ncbi:MAG TPA: hypothetical protein VKC54_03570, partial [Patescibacteria group bacterium]|nr:hypothetical protein [Patescibacteria group bacterium]
LQGLRYEGQAKYRLSRLGFDKTKLQALDHLKIVQDKTLADLQNLRAGRGREVKRTIEEGDSKKNIPTILDKDEQKLMDELSEIRSGDQGREIGGGDTNENPSMASADDELKDSQDEDKEADDEEKNGDTDDSDYPADEME